MDIVRRFIVGSEWLYIKIYSGPKTLEDILINDVYYIVKDLYYHQIIDKFFFVRYFEESHHLRLRFHLVDAQKVGIVLTQFSNGFKELINCRIIANLTTDTYQREIERYGSNTMELFESLFSCNSWDIIHILKSNEDYTDRWLEGVKWLDILLDKFGLSVEDKYHLHQKYFEEYSKEFGASKQVNEILKNIYRENKKIIEGGLIPNNDFISASANLNTIDNLDDIIKKILLFKENAELEVPLEKILNSLLHMHYNRLFRVNQRAHEFVLYYMLSNFYKSLNIRQTKLKVV